MKSLKTYLECGEGYATPANTMGMGNPGQIDADTLTEPIGSIEKTAKALRQNEKPKKKKHKIKESLFDPGLVEKDPWEDEGFKRWINREDVLWYIYFYWEDDMEDPLQDFCREEWTKYKPIVDTLLDIINKQMKKVGCFTWGAICYDWVDMDPDHYNMFNNMEDAIDFIDAACYEIEHKSVGDFDGIWKVMFKGPMPKNSNVTELFCSINEKLKPNKVDGGIFLTNQDTVISMCFPKGLDKNILNIFNIK